MKGRTPPPAIPIIFALPRANDPSLAIDAAFFARTTQRHYTRRYIQGETPDPMHPDTLVWVQLIGVERVRGFAPPPVGRDN